jgi:hypothetical protein
MFKFGLGLGALAAAAVLSSGIVAVAQDKKAPKKPPACNAIKTQAACEARGDCQWIAALLDKDGKQKRKAYCKSKPQK